MAKKGKEQPPLSRSFPATLERLRSSLGWVIVRVPLAVASLWGARGRLKVKGEINGFPFRTSLFPTREGTHFVLVNKRMQKGARASVGTTVHMRLEPDSDERVVAIPEELKRALSEERVLLRWFKKLNYSMQKWITDQVIDVKTAEARQRRCDRIAEQLLAAMEAEQELPPMIRLAFARTPGAREGWNQMSPTRRRANLLAIFYYRSPEARERRLAKVVEEAAVMAGKKTAKTRS